MRTFLLSYLDQLRSSYWFIPGAMSIGAIVLAFAATALDAQMGTKWLKALSWIATNDASGAREILGTIAGSMITVAGVVFSITIAAVSYASGQYGPRLLTNFMRDQANQVTLGTFIATFLYCLLVIRAVHGPDDAMAGGAEAGDGSGAFVPQIAVLIGMALAVCSIAVLIYYIHHVPRSIHISYVIADIGKDLERKILARFPQTIGRDIPNTESLQEAERDIPVPFREGGGASEGPLREHVEHIAALNDGYIQAIDDRTMLKIATDHDLVLRLRYRPGHFVYADRTLIEAWPAANVTADVERRLRRSYVHGTERTPVQDVQFLVDELAEIAIRALSPGVNDPFTAISCLNWLGAAVVRLSRQKLPDRLRYDDAGDLRVIADPQTFAGFVELGFGRMRPYVAADPNAALHMMATLGEVGAAVATGPGRRVLHEQAERLLEAAAVAMPAHDLARVQQQARPVLRVLSRPQGAEPSFEDLGWRDGGA